MTGVDADLATLRDWIGDPEDYSDEDRGAAERACDACDGVEAELSRLREQRDALRADYGDALKEVDELLDLMDAGREHIEPHDPIAPFLSAGWQCPVCDRRGDVHDERCLVLELVTVARRRKDGNRRLVETNGRLRETAEAAEARFTESEARCARLREELARVAGLHERDFGHPGETPEGAATEPLGQESLDRGEALDGLSFVGGADLDGDGNGGGETGKRASGHMPNHTAYGMESKLEAAEARCARLQQALGEMESAALKAAQLLPMTLSTSVEADHRSDHPSWAGWLLRHKVLPVARESLAGPDKPADSQEDEWFIPEGDRQCGVVHKMARATCMKRRGHDGSHATPQGTWIDGPWCEYPADSQEDKT